MKALGYNVGSASPTIMCKLFEDNIRAMTMAQALDMKPRTKPINTKYNYLCVYVFNSTMYILPIESCNQP